MQGMDIFLNICFPFDLQSNSQVWIVRAWHSNDAHLGLNANLKHSHTGVSTKKYNLIMEAESTTVKKHSQWHAEKSCDICYSCPDRCSLFRSNLGLSHRFPRA